ncbi:MAG: serine--tRNA ligase [Planctomycetes bacterium]|jgi:seryl-tRNA synthetase|nr:serine--tRNA ligase [Planctomycetota bacterium]
MLDIKKIREQTNEVKQALLKRLEEKDFDLGEIIKLDDERKILVKKGDDCKAERNSYSKTKPSPEIIANMKKLGEEIKEVEEKINTIENELKEKLAALPNLPAEDVVAGGKENNEVILTVGEKPNFNFTPKDHVELATNLDIIDYKRAAKMSGAGFWIYKGQGAILEWALLNYFINFHLANNYTFILPPYLLNEESAYASGHLPKFRDELFWTQDKLCLNATSEMMLNNYHRDEVLIEKELPLKYFSYSACFRREAGSYRKEERGMIRGHQFNKIEMFQFTHPQDSWQAFTELRQNAESLVTGLGLHFQTTKLAAGDCSSAMAKTYDIEIWIPSMGIYKEVSSVSNALDYQARRSNIRYKTSEGKNEYVHTLNGSGLATSRLIPAILEQCQEADGRVRIPEVLRPYFPNKQEYLSN